jgi:periplasmic divalent cation tolerance protein
MAAALEIHTTFASEEDAVSVVRTLVSERLCACAQVLPGVTSVYYWEGMLRHEQEVLVLLKTTPEAWPALRDRLTELHTYETPEIVALPIEHTTFEYLAWMKENIKQR